MTENGKDRKPEIDWTNKRVFNLKVPDFGDRARCSSEYFEIFFPEHESGRSALMAKRFCHACEVREECLEFAINAQVEGIWGGSTTNERKLIYTHRRRQQRLAAETVA